MTPPANGQYSPLKHPRRLLVLMLPIVLLIGIAMFIIFRIELNRRHTSMARQAHEAVAISTESIGRIIQDISHDLRYLSDDTGMLRVLDNPNEKNMSDLATDWVSFSLNKQMYDKIRWIDENGMERLRVNYSQSKPIRVPVSELQDKSKRYFFADVFKLNAGEIFVSPLDLNVEHDEIEVPYKPTIRLGVPVFDSQGRKRGILLINYLANDLLFAFEKSFRSYKRSGWLLNKDGYWLKSDKPDDEYAFMFGRMEVSMAKRYPEAWKKIASSESGSFVNQEGLWTFTTVIPLLESQKSSTGSPDILAASKAQLESRKYVWKAVFLMPIAEYNSGFLAFTLEIAGASLIIVFLFFIGVWRLVHAQLVEEGLRDHLEQLVQKRTEELTLANESLSEREVRLSTLIQTIPDLIWVKDQEGIYLACNSAVERLFGADRSKIIGSKGEAFLGAEQLAAFHADDMAAIASGKPLIVEEWLTFADDGHRALYEVLKVPMRKQTGELVGIVGIGRDITERKQAEERLKLAALVSDNTSQAIMVTDANGMIIAVNPGYERITGYTEAEVLGKNPSLLSSGRQDRAFYQAMWHSLNTSGHWQGEIWNKRKNGEIYPAWITINAIRSPDGAIERYVELCSDLTNKKKAEDMIFQQTNFDSLTGLPNRHMFLEKLEHEISTAQNLGLPLALMILDLDHFKDVNDTLGHDMGDKLLKDASERLKSCVRDTDTVSRLGGDEFTVILSAVEDIGRVERVTQNILHRLSEPFQLGNEQVHVSASVGVAMFPDDATTADDLLKNADQAMYAAKKEGRNRRNYFMPAMQETAQTKLRLMNDLRSALSDRQFMVVYQPIVDLESGEIHKAESLIRWNHPQRGLISPAQFITLAEEIEVIVDIGNWMFREAAQQAAKWRVKYHPDFQISVNMSPVQFRNAGISHKTWGHYLKTLGIPGQGVVIEITEGLLMDASDTITKQLLEFRDAGMEVALDDFGTGYSSLSYIKKFDIDYLKIDQSFVRNLAPDSSDLALCEAIIVMAHKLGIKVIAEGVETQLQRDLLAAAGCNYGQGRMFSMPLAAEDFEKLFPTAP
ncbi:MAG: EAL domain-containing protein [Oxalobacter sp.]|nr:MAG: EAL domain-containing protein [Oxalobacter sp.]